MFKKENLINAIKSLDGKAVRNQEEPIAESTFLQSFDTSKLNIDPFGTDESLPPAEGKSDLTDGQGKPREWWLDLHFRSVCSGTFPQAVHVVEKSAYDRAHWELKEEYNQVRMERDLIKAELQMAPSFEMYEALRKERDEWQQAWANAGNLVLPLNERIAQLEASECRPFDAYYKTCEVVNGQLEGQIKEQETTINYLGECIARIEMERDELKQMWEIAEDDREDLATALEVRKQDCKALHDGDNKRINRLENALFYAKQVISSSHEIGSELAAEQLTVIERLESGE